MFTGILLVQAFYQVLSRHIENQQPEDSISNGNIQHQLQDLLRPLFQPNDEDNVGNVLNIIPYTDRKRPKGKKDAPMTIILTTNLSKKGKQKGKKDVVIAVQTLNSYGAPLPDIESLLNLSRHNMTESPEYSENVPYTAEITNEGTSEWLESDEDQDTRRMQMIQKHNAQKGHHHAVPNNDKTPETLNILKIDNPNVRRKHQKPKHIKINVVRTVHPSSAEQLSMEEQPSTGELTEELPSIERQASASEQTSSAEQPDIVKQQNLAEQSSTVEELSPLELPNAVEESSNIQQSNAEGKSNTTKDSDTVEERNMSEELITMEQLSTEEQLSAVEHDSTMKQASTDKQINSSEQLSSPEQLSTIEQSSTAEKPSITLEPNTWEQRSAAMETGFVDPTSTQEEHNTAEYLNIAEYSSSLEHPGTAEQSSNMEQSHTAEQTRTAEVINTAQQRGNIDIISNEENVNLRAPGEQNPETENQSTDVSMTLENTVRNRVPDIESINVEYYLEEQLGRDLKQQTTIKPHVPGIIKPRGQIPIIAEESIDEVPPTSKVIPEHQSVADIYMIREQIQHEKEIVEESTTEKSVTYELTSEITSDISLEVSADHSSIAEMPIKRLTPRTEKKHLKWEPITPKPISLEKYTVQRPTTSEITQEQLELINDGIILEQYNLENEPVIDEYTEEQQENVSLEDRVEEEYKKSILLQVNSEQLGVINGDALLEKYEIENKPKIAENTEERSNLKNGENPGVTSEEATTSEVTVIKNTHIQGKKKIHKLVEEPTAETLVTSEAALEQLGLISGDTILEQYILENKPVTAENIEEEPGLVTIQDRTEDELEEISEEPSMSKIIVTRKTRRKGKKKRQKPKAVPVEKSTGEIPVASEMTPEQLGLLNSDPMLEQYILENSPLLGEEQGEGIIAGRISEEPEDNYEELIPNISALRDYNTYDDPNAENAALPDAETTNILNVLLRQNEINSLLNAQNNGEHQDLKTEPLVIVVPNLDKSIDCPDKEKLLSNEETRLINEDIMKRLNWDSNEIPLDVSNRNILGTDILNQDLLNSEYILRNENKNNDLLSEKKDLRRDNWDEIISRYNKDEILRNDYRGSGVDGLGHGGAGGIGDYYTEQEEQLDNQVTSKQISGGRSTNINGTDSKRSEHNMEVLKSYNLSFTFNRK